MSTRQRLRAGSDLSEYEPRHSKNNIDRNRELSSAITTTIDTRSVELHEPAIGRNVGTSALWSALNAGVLRASTFALSLLVARLVAPYEFGVFTVAFTILMFALSLPELGVSSAIVREHNRSKEIASTVFTISLVGGGLLALAMFFFAPFFARELGAADAASAVRVLSVVPFLAGFTVVPTALMSRDFMQRKRFIADAAFFVVSTATMLILVLNGHAVMGLAWSQVAGHIVSVVLLVWMAPERHWPGFRWNEATHLLSFGLPLAGANLISMGIVNVDFVVVGHWLGAQKLAYYNLAYSISGWPITIFSAILVSVTLPTLSRVRHNPHELTRHLRAGLSAIAVASFPVYAILCALAGPLIDIVYGTRWNAAWSALVVLAIFGATRSVVLMLSDLAVALGLTRRLLNIQLIWFGALVPAMVVCVTRWGILGAGIAHAIVVVFVVLPMYLVTLHRKTPVPVGSLRFVLGRPLVASVGCALAAYGGAQVVEGNVPKLLLGVACGLATYALLGGRWLLRVGRSLRAMYWNRGADSSDASRPPSGPAPSPSGQLAVPRG